MADDHSHTTAGDIRAAFFLNLTFTVFEIAGGLWTNSLAILSDAIHDLGDSFSLGLAWYLEGYADREMDRRFSYGYRRFSLLGALLTTVILIAGSLFILSEAIPRLFQPEPSNAGGMVVFAVVGVLVNGIAALRVRRGESMSARVVAWHFIEDVLGWLAVLVVSVTLLFTDLYILDPILSILITLYVLINVIRNLRKTLALFLQAVPDNINIDEINARLLAIDKVLSTHHTHVWSMDGQQHVLTAHVVVEENAERQDVHCIKEEIGQMSRDLHLVHTTVEIEFGDEDCGMKAG